MVIIVTGARSGARQADVSRALDAWHGARPVGVLIHGDCPDPDPRNAPLDGWVSAAECVAMGARGEFPQGLSVDACADRWARAQLPRVVPHRYPAAWDVHGVAAGPMRNRWMANELARYRAAGCKVAVLAFPGGDGTADMVKAAHAQRLPVWRWRGAEWVRDEPRQVEMLGA